MTTFNPPSTPEDAKRIEAFVTKIERLFSTLYVRWQDEKEHEGIAEYGARLAREFPDGWTLLGMSKKPFGCKFTIGTTAEYLIYATSRVYGWKRTK